ncbi:MAG TPA: hypothetical protein VGM13_02865 [Thermoanaerobaculia bacterium]|jgi:hypothetical protein
MIRRILSAVLAAASLSLPLAASDVGLQVALEQWNPATPDQASMKVLFDSPSMVSFQVTQAWNQQRDQVCQEITATITKADALSKGVSAYNVNCTMADVSEFHAAGTGVNQGRFTFRLVGNTLNFTTTTPTVLGSYADPRFNTTYDVLVTVNALMQNGSPLLKVTQAIGQIQNPHVAPGNFAADVLKGVSGFIVQGGLDGVVAKSVAGQKMNLTGRINGSLGAANALLKAPDGSKFAGGWVRKDKIYIGFQPVMSVAASGGGWVNGKLKWPGQAGQSVSCAGFAVKATVPAGPPEVLGPDPWSFGAYATRGAGTLSLQSNGVFAGDHYECAYSLLGLPAGYPAELSASVGQGGTAKGGSLVIPVMAPDGWNGHVTPNANGRDFKETWRSSGVSPAMKLALIPIHPGDPDPSKSKILVNPAVKSQTNVKVGTAPVVAGQVKQ